MPKLSIVDKAKLLVAGGFVKPSGHGAYLVQGEHDEYLVDTYFVKGARRLGCSCPAGEFRAGCSHKLAVEMYEKGDVTMGTFDAQAHLMQLKGKDYLEVKWRLVWFRTDHPAASGWGIITEAEVVTEQAARYRARIVDPEGRVVATGTKTETQKGFPDFVEKAETGSIGRALALLGYGTQFTGDELDEGERIVDSPVERRTPPAGPPSPPVAQPPTTASAAARKPPGRAPGVAQQTPDYGPLGDPADQASPFDEGKPPAAAPKPLVQEAPVYDATGTPANEAALAFDRIAKWEALAEEMVVGGGVDPETEKATQHSGALRTHLLEMGVGVGPGQALKVAVGYGEIDWPALTKEQRIVVLWEAQRVQAERS